MDNQKRLWNRFFRIPFKVFFANIILFIFTLFPSTMGHVAAFFGIYSPVNMIFFMGFVLSLVIIFTLTVALSRVTARVRKLAQMIALQDEEKREK